MAFGVIIIGDEILSGRRTDKHLPKVIQLLTERGLALFPVVLELMKFGNKWLPCDAPPVMLYHTECGKLTEPGQTCSACGGPMKLGNVRLVENGNS